MKFNWKKRLIKPSDLTSVGEKIRKKDKTIVYTAGAWDMLHVGQVRYLQEAKKLADVLIVGVSSNQTVSELKGNNRPILDEKIRAEMLTYLRFVDLVTIVPQKSNQPTIALLKPDFYVTVKEGWNEGYQQSKEYKTITAHGGRVELVDRQSPFISTTQILKRTVSSHLNEVLKDLMSVSEKPLQEK
ncbi:MAG: adenylyltransferase/cytidyltransferase family protein [Candidatus Pacebacteria bacterium]|nr:adenylyltransferase/cytidyltransferase family protein [Candidatus Paceibacterota bacterium]